MGAIVRNGEIYGSNMAINDAQTSENTTWSSEKIDNINNALDGRLDTAEDDIDALSQKISNSGDTYSSTKAYVVGDLCIYNNVLYRCITACSAGSWATNKSCFVADTLTNSSNQKQVVCYKSGSFNNGTIATSAVENICSKLINEGIEGFRSFGFVITGSSMYLGNAYVYPSAKRVFGLCIPQNFEAPGGIMLFKYDSGTITAKKIVFTNW